MILKGELMFIAHLPAGYLLTRTLFLKTGQSFSLLVAGLFFAIAPDLDLLWFYLLSARQVPHHQYFTHWPLFWLALFGLTFFISLVLNKVSWRSYLKVSLAAALLHLVLDSIAAEIFWFAPFSAFHLNAVAVPARYGWWVWNFLLHWTFVIEICICFAAGVALYHTSARRRH